MNLKYNMDLNELASPQRNYERSVRLMTLENIKTVLKIYERTREERWLQAAKELGQFSEFFKRRIKNHDFSTADQAWERVREWDKEITKLFETYERDNG
jgi:predicted translin family RNA/ssDNA-binding protein